MTAKRLWVTPPLSVTQASVESGRPARTIRHAIKTGSLQAHKLPGATGAYLIKRRDFDTWMQNCFEGENLGEVEMASDIKVPDEDLAEADRLEAQAKQVEDPDEAAALRRIAGHLRMPWCFPVMDHPRAEENRELSRQVVKEFGAIAPYFPEDDSYRTLPLRLAHNAAGGFRIEFGPFSLGRRELRVLHRAIVEWARYEAPAQEYPTTTRQDDRRIVQRQPVRRRSMRSEGG
ncbi:hypothetical protein [Mycolicibacter sinensis]|uniref:hypothetical protein n=1 Tax=Mycolicibacter sinensis (strain JDM601) TaxID=875328 RepID=UPI000AD60024|nr:hypothetical protein [Mycolicibacter sinensis]